MEKSFCYTRSKVNFSLGPFKRVDLVARKKIGVVATQLKNKNYYYYGSKESKEGAGEESGKEESGS